MSASAVARAGHLSLARMALRVVAAGALLTAAHTVDSLISIRAALESAVQQGTGAARAVRNGRTQAAAAKLQEAERHAAEASRAAEDPILAVFSAALGRTSDLGALRSIAGAVDLTLRAGAASASAAQEIAPDGHLFPALFEDGRIDLAAVSKLPVASERAAVLVGRALEKLAGARPQAAVLRSAVDQAEGRLRSVAAAVNQGRDVLEILPGFAGAQGPRRYLVAFLNPSEARGGGGLLGVYGVLTLDEGRVDMSEVIPIREVAGRRRAVTSPAWFHQLYGRLMGATEWRQANLSVSFPVTAELWLEMHERQTQQVLDGAVAVDPFVLGQLSRGTGMLRAGGWNERIGPRDARRMLGLGELSPPTASLVDRPFNMAITPRSATRVLGHDMYLKFHRAEYLQNRYLQGLVWSLWNRIGEGDIHAGASMRALGRSIDSGHLKLYSRDEREQALWSRLKADGDPASFGRDAQMVFHNNFGANKVDFFLHRHVDTDVALLPSGDAQVTTTIELDNRAPAGPLTVLLRSGLQKDYPPGLNRMGLSLLAPRGARITSLSVDGRKTHFMTGREGPFPVAWQLVDVPRAETVQVSATYRWPEAWDTATGTFSLDLLPHAAVRPDRFSVSVKPPAGSAVAQAQGATHSRSEARASGMLGRPRSIVVQVTGASN